MSSRPDDLGQCLSESEKITVVRDRVLTEIGFSDTWNQPE